MECKWVLICIIQILNLHAIFAATVLSWEVDTSNLEQSTIGGTLKLICNGTGTSCCSGLREWKGGPGFIGLVVNGASTDASKYAEEVGSDYFSLVIKNLEDSDFQVDYQCFHNFDDSPRNKLNPGTVFHYTPDHTDIQVISKLDTDGGDLSYAVNVTKVYPKPTCFAMFQNDNITNYMDVNVIDDPSVFMYCEVNVTDAKYSCPGSLEISCNAPPFVSFSINPTSPCASKECKIYFACILADFCVFLSILGLITLFILTGCCKRNNTKQIEDCGKRIWAAILFLIVCFIMVRIVSSLLIAHFEQCSCKDEVVHPVTVFLSLCVLAGYVALLVWKIDHNMPGWGIVIIVILICSGVGVIPLVFYLVIKLFENNDVDPVPPITITVHLKFCPLQIHVEWQAPTLHNDTVKGYEIYYRLIEKDNYKTGIPTNLNAQSHTLDKVKPNEIYVVWMKYTTSNSSGISNTVTISTLEGESKEVELLQTVTLLKAMKNYPEISSVIWTKDGTWINVDQSLRYRGGTIKNHSLTIRYSSCEDSGQYQCKLKFTKVPTDEEIGGNVSDVTLNVNLKVKDVKPVSVTFTEDAVLFANLKTDRDLDSVKWSFREENLITENSSIYKGGNTECPHLTVLYASPNDSGEYICTLRFKQNNADTVKKSEDEQTYSARLEVKGHGADQMIPLTKDVKLLDFLVSHPNIASVQWMHDETKIPIQSSLYEGGNDTNPPLKVLYASMQDSGRYTCILSFRKPTIEHSREDTERKKKEKTFSVTLKVDGSRANQMTPLTKDVILLGDLKGHQNLALVEWAHNTKKIRTDRSYLYEGGTKTEPFLKIMCASMKDSGQYTCTLTFNKNTTESNETEADKDKETKKFDVQLKVDDSSENQKIPPSKEITLLSGLKSHPSLKSVTWMFKEKEIIAVNNPIYEGGKTNNPPLKVVCASKEDSGKYTCILKYNNTLTEAATDVDYEEMKLFEIKLKVVGNKKEQGKIPTT